MRASTVFAALLAAALLAGCSGDSGAPATPGSPAAAPEAAAPPVDPAELRRRAELDEERARFRSLREAFLRGGRPSAASGRRLDAALRAASTSVRWDVACRGLACRVAGEPAVAAAVIVDSDPGVRRIADRVAADPDGAAPERYVLLAEEGAAPGDAVLEQVETALRASEEARACAARAQAAGTVEYELRLDTTGFTYRTDGDLPWPVVDCVNDALAEILRTTSVPRNAKSAVRRVALRL